MNYCDKQYKQKTNLLGLYSCLDYIVVSNILILMNIISNREAMKKVNLF